MTLILSESLERLFYLAAGESILGLSYALQIYYWVLTVRAVLNWFANINPFIQPWYILLEAADPYFKLFERWLPVLFGIDLSYIVAFSILEFIINLCINLGSSLKYSAMIV